MGILERLSEVAGRVRGAKSPPSVQTAEVNRSQLLQKIQETHLFSDIPRKNLEEMLDHMETIKVPEGAVVVREGDEGDYYYLLVSGVAKVTRVDSVHGKEIAVAEISEPIGFGEEALISNQKRNATVSMATNGVLMRLSKDSFNDYVKQPLVSWLFPREAFARIRDGAQWIDVRGSNQPLPERLQGSLSISLERIRERASELDTSIEYICYCRNGRLSSTAAFLLRQRGIKASVLRGGLKALQDNN